MHEPDEEKAPPIKPTASTFLEGLVVEVRSQRPRKRWDAD